MASASSSSAGKQPSTSSAIANSAINLLSTLIPSSSSSSSSSPSSSATATTNSLSSSQSTKASPSASASHQSSSSSSSSDIPHQPLLRPTRSRPNFRSSPSPLQASWSVEEYEPEKDFSSFSNSNHQVNYSTTSSSYTNFLQDTNNDHNHDISNNNETTTATTATTRTLVLNPLLTTTNNPSPDILAAQLHDGLAVLSLLSSSVDETGQHYYDEVEALPSLNIWTEMERNYQNKVNNSRFSSNEEEELQLDLGLQMSLGLDVAEDPVEWLMMTGPGGEYTEQVWGDKVVEEENDLRVEQGQEEDEVPVQLNKGKERAVERSPVIMRSRM